VSRGSSSGSSASSHGTAVVRGSSPETRHPRAGTGAARYGYYGHSSYYYGYYPFYYPFYGYYGYYPGYYPYYPYGGGAYYPAYHYNYGDVGSIRLLVEPNQARVYVDGYYAGVVDDFDGLFQRLHVAPGRHEITLKLDGYKTHRMRVYVPYDGTLKLHYQMEKGEGEDVAEDLTTPEDRAAEARDRERERYRDPDEGYRMQERDRGREEARGPMGELHLSVRPDDASVYVDGEFRGSGHQARQLVISPGRHRIEVVRPGFRTYDREVDVREGAPVELEVELERP
jgi:hypothetical protein